MNAVLAIIADGGRAIVVIYREAVEINYFFHLLYNFILNPLMAASSNPLQRGWGGVLSSMKTMPLDGKMAHHGEDVCVICVSLPKHLPSGRFLFPPEHT